jgi:hypothetical protein
MQARQAYARTLREKAQVLVLLRTPAASFAVDDTRTKGRPEAPITIVEFSDFQCPFCKNASTTVGHLAEKYGEDVRLAFRDVPLRHLYPHAQIAAGASRCAADQGRFWDYHDLLFANQDRLDRNGLLAHAATLNLDNSASAGVSTPANTTTPLRRISRKLKPPAYSEHPLSSSTAFCSRATSPRRCLGRSSKKSRPTSGTRMPAMRSVSRTRGGTHRARIDLLKSSRTAAAIRQPSVT